MTYPIAIDPSSRLGELVALAMWGKCHSCARPCQPNRKLCVHHGELARKYNARVRLRRRKMKQCTRCGGKPREGALMCQRCRLDGKMRMGRRP